VAVLTSFASGAVIISFNQIAGRYPPITSMCWPPSVPPSPRTSTNPNTPHTPKQDAPWLDGQYQVFGRVLAGMELVDAISHIQVDEREAPVLPVTIQSTGELAIRRADSADEVAEANARSTGTKPESGTVKVAALDGDDTQSVADALEAAGLDKEPLAALPKDLQVHPEPGAAEEAAGPVITQLVYFDLEQAGSDLGRITIGL